MTKRYTVLFRFTKPGETKPGPIQRYVLYAESLEHARQELKRYANYPNIQVISVRET